MQIIKYAVVYFTSILFFLVSEIHAQSTKGSITGTVQDSTTKEMLVGVTVQVEGTTIGVFTNENGRFILNGLAAGDYTLRVSYVSYNNKIKNNLKVTANDTLNIGMVKLSTSIVLKEVVVVGAKVTSTQMAVMEEIKKSESIVSGIGAQQILRGQSRTAADVVRLVPGVTVQDNRFIMIRGLTPRYNSVLLNNVFAPSSEAEARAFSFDMLPANMIDRVLIYKTASPELPGDFAGGVVKVFTKSVPDVNSIKISYSTSFRDNTTNRDFYNVNQGDQFWLSFDKGYHALPSEFPDVSTFSRVLGTFETPQDLDERIRLNKLFSNKDWYPTLAKAPLDQRFGADFSGRFKLGDKLILGTATSLGYSNTKAYTSGKRQLRSPGNYNGDSTQFLFDFNDQIYEHSVRLSGLQNFALLIGSKHKIEFKNLYNHFGNSIYSYAYGFDYNSGPYLKYNTLLNSFRSLYTSQLLGEHTILKNLNFSWVSGYSATSTDEPDLKNYSYTANVPVLTDPRLDGYQAPFDTIVPFFSDIAVGTVLSATSPARYYGKTLETSRSAGFDLDYLVEIPVLKWFQPKIKIGYFHEFKERNSFTRLIGYTVNEFSSLENIGYEAVDSVYLEENFSLDGEGLLISEGAFISPNYILENEYNASYVSVNLPIGKKINLIGGVRSEHNVRKIGIDKTQRFSPIIFPYVEDSVIVLPSYNLSYRIHKKHLFRVAYAQTINRPEYREASPSSYFENIRNPKIIITGNPLLKTASVKNYDFRYEWYPYAGATISLAAFYKKFTNPIEQIFLGADGTTPDGSIINTPEATNYGMEIEVVQSFRNLFETHHFLSDFSINANAAIIKSRIEVLDPTNKLIIQQYNSDRPLFGQAPYIFNAGIYYQNDSLGLALNIAYNITGPRIFRVGSVGIPDVYEMPVNMVDMSISKKIFKYLEIKFGVQNLFNSEFLFLQYFTEDKKVPGFVKEGPSVNKYNAFRTGRYYTLGFTFKI